MIESVNIYGYTVLILEIFLVQKISWWSNTPIFNTPFWETFEGTLVKLWSIKVEVLEVRWVGDCISCFKPCIVQNWW